jgi:hypothetical protein
MRERYREFLRRSFEEQEREDEENPSRRASSDHPVPDAGQAIQAGSHHRVARQSRFAVGRPQQAPLTFCLRDH